jgi:hypothetical protein
MNISKDVSRRVGNACGGSLNDFIPLSCDSTAREHLFDTYEGYLKLIVEHESSDLRSQNWNMRTYPLPSSVV